MMSYLLFSPDSGGLSIFTSFAGDVVFRSLVSHWLMLMTAVSLLCFTVSEVTRNYSQVDKLWSLMPVFYSIITLLFFQSPRLVIMAILVAVWGLRLTWNFGRKGGYSIIPWKGEEDYRWKVLREHPVFRSRLRFGLFNLLFISFYQNILILLFSTPLLLAVLYPQQSLGILDFVAAFLMLGFIVLETVADNQQYRFHQEKKDRIERKDMIYGESVKRGFLSQGLWAYSRHPNFAAEQAIWVSFYLFGVSASGQWLNPTLIGSVLLIFLFSGSSWLTEWISSSKYPAYRDYKTKVARFIPFFR